MKSTLALQQTTRQIIGRARVSVLALYNLDLRAGTGEYRANGHAYDAVRVGTLWFLTGDYVII